MHNCIVVVFVSPHQNDHVFKTTSFFKAQGRWLYSIFTASSTVSPVFQDILNSSFLAFWLKI